ncbi:hypothetical protein T552_00212 [Pneumocystis carinii B80]|uniref:CAP-Gly domain-containing protein n=1 Tax=Pneumocystis carinii (strain B80) TaxID=1408658 RepID=A0A0W4ZT80_PNEC8|nr:hypothetical protein T552_00212 [Pneumocystis carinii B80]KTW31574.1 hypothetical protein T552_00212 [Pneumocystis carinii B80]
MLSINDRVFVGKTLGTVRYIGQTDFSTGEWIGVELDKPTGKNDGSVKGVKYFECKENYGVFVRVSAVKKAELGEKERVDEDVNECKESKRSGCIALSKRNIFQSPEGLGTASRIPYIQSLTGQQKIIYTKVPFKESISPCKNKGNDVVSEELEGEIKTGSRICRPIIGYKIFEEGKDNTENNGEEGSRSEESILGGELISFEGLKEPYQDLYKKKEEGGMIEEMRRELKVLEKKRMEDRDRLKFLEDQLQEKESIEKSRNRLQNKILSLQDEIRDLKLSLRNMENEKAEIEIKFIEVSEMLEVTTLDKEIAEQRVDILESEFSAFKNEMQNNLDKRSEDISKKEEDELNEDDLEEQNKVLKEALIKLHTMTNNQEIEFKNTIKHHQLEIESLKKYKVQYESLKEKLQETENLVDDLRQQVDISSTAEEMLEELTEKNLYLKEKIEQMNITIQDLESLKELNDELEENHLENERQMREELEYKDSILMENTNKITQLKEINSEYELVILRFKELVGNLQRDLENLRLENQNAKMESTELNIRSKEIMDLNLKLKSSSVKSQATKIEYELKKLEGLEAIEKFKIAQFFLPESYSCENSSIMVYFKCRRIAMKSLLLHDIIKEKISYNISINNILEIDSLLEAMEINRNLVLLNTIARRFTDFMNICTLLEFDEISSSFSKLDILENMLDTEINILKKNEYCKKEFLGVLKEAVLIFNNLSGVYIKSYDGELISKIESELFLSLSYVENFLKEESILRNLFESDYMKQIIGENSESILILIKQLETFSSKVEEIRVIINKLFKIIDYMKENSLSLKETIVSEFFDLKDMANFLYNEMKKNLEYFNELLSKHLEGIGVCFSEKDILLDLNLDNISEKISSFTFILLKLEKNIHYPENSFQIFQNTSPWILHSNEIKSILEKNNEAEKKLNILQDRINQYIIDIRLKDKIIEEVNIKTELLNKRTDDLKRNSETIKMLEKSLNDALLKEKQYIETVKSLNKKTKSMEKIINNFKSTRHVSDINSLEESIVNSQIFQNKLQEFSNEAEFSNNSILYLREEIKLLSINKMILDNSWLSEPLFKTNDEFSKKREKRAAEIRFLLKSLRTFSSKTSVIKLSFQKQNGWISETKRPRYKHFKQQEEYVSLCAKRDSLVSIRDFTFRKPICRSTTTPLVHCTLQIPSYMFNNIQQNDLLLQNIEINHFKELERIHHSILKPLRIS